jgi:hypothetical protein
LAISSLFIKRTILGFNGSSASEVLTVTRARKLKCTARFYLVAQIKDTSLLHATKRTIIIFSLCQFAIICCTIVLSETRQLQLCFSTFIYILVPCRGRECSHHAEGIARGNQGICQCPTKCPDNVKPRQICASDGNTYDNECELKNASCQQQKPLQIKHEGPCSKYCFFDV